MGAWLIFLKERFPLPAYILLSGGLALSGSAFDNNPNPLWTFVGFLLVILFFAELRLMDELKDYKKDQIANPTRPLPRGILKPEQVAKAVRILAGVMALSSVALFFKSPTVGLLYGFVTLYLWLMFREFYAGPWLEKQMLVYAISHQVILLPLVFFCASLHDNSDLILTGSLLAPVFCWAMMVLGAFFTYEVCRKLDPKSHPVLKTYLQIYGPQGSGLIVLVASMISFVAAFGWMSVWDTGVTGFASLVVPLLAPLTLFGILEIAKKPGSYKWIEIAATLALAVQIWIPFLARMLP